MRAVVRLLVIAKEPVPGKVKTRLTPPYSPDEAAALAAAALADTLDTVVAACRSSRLAGQRRRDDGAAAPPEAALPGSPAGGARPVVVLDGEPGPWLPPGVPVVGQAAGPFDERLAAAFDGVRGEPALLIGMDTPQVRPNLLVAACLALREADAVFGPALDGGWWALGLRCADGRMVRGIPTSRPDTGALQRARLRAANLTVVDLPTLRDVDTAADVEPVARLAPAGRFATTFRLEHPCFGERPVADEPLQAGLGDEVHRAAEDFLQIEFKINNLPA